MKLLCNLLAQHTPEKKTYRDRMHTPIKCTHSPILILNRKNLSCRSCSRLLRAAVERNCSGDRPSLRTQSQSVLEKDGFLKKRPHEHTQEPQRWHIILMTPLICTFTRRGASRGQHVWLNMTQHVSCPRWEGILSQTRPVSPVSRAVPDPA